MRQVGTRRERPISGKPSAAQLVQSARFFETIARLSPSTFIRKGVYRFKTHEEANRHADDCLARGMASLALDERG
jgi:hypothetical protein